jgi:hypothetical protein
MSNSEGSCLEKQETHSAVLTDELFFQQSDLVIESTDLRGLVVFDRFDLTRETRQDKRERSETLGDTCQDGTLIALARLAYFNVDRVSSKLHIAGEMAATITVMELPPRLSCNTRVNLEFR